MEKFNNHARRGLSYLLIYLTALQPLHPAFAALTPDNLRTQVKNAGNVPVVNIATPNAAGISHNTYKDFSVGTPGTVLNNSTAAGKSQLAGQLGANANLKGKAAGLIINEVTGAARSTLQGKVEIFGGKANLLIANPNGITCDGCGFINTPAVTLTTGKPLLDKQGALEALEVKKGGITIGGKGLDGGGADYVDILSRAAELNGKISAKNLSLVQGSNRVNLKTGVISPINGEGAKPQLAVDTKALGGMYAERIRLVATEEGVGANLANLTSTQQDITLSAKGKIQLGHTSARTDLNISGRETNIAAGTNLRSVRDMTLASATLNNNGSIVSNGDMRIFADTVRNVGDAATLHTNHSMWIQKDAAGNKSSKIENRSGTIKTNSGDMVIRTEQLENVRNKFELKRANITTTSRELEKVIGQDVEIENMDNKYAVNYIAYIKDAALHWFGKVDIKTSPIANTERFNYVVAQKGKEGLIQSGRNAYINALTLNNINSNINSIKNLIITGKNLKNENTQWGETNGFVSFTPEKDVSYILGRFHNLPIGNAIKVAYNYKPYYKTWQLTDSAPGKLSAGGNLVADFTDSVNINAIQSYDTKNTTDVSYKITSPEAVSAKNIVLHSKNINISNAIKSTGDLTIIADENVNIANGSLNAKNAASLLSTNNIDSRQSNISGRR